MAKIDPTLLAKLMAKSGLGQAAMYARIGKKANERFLSRDLAALAVAADLGISINKYATQSQLDRLQIDREPAPTPSTPAVAPLRVTRGRAAKAKSKVQPNTVFVVHGRDTAVAESMFQVLRALGLEPIEWNEAVGYTKSAAPSILTVIAKAFERAQVAVILFTPDEEVQLHEQFRNPHDDDDAKLWSQARPNVFFEAGIALALRPDQTVLVEVGKVRPFTDISGLHVVRLSENSTTRNNFVQKLKNAGLHPNTTGNHWMTVGNFVPTQPQPTKKR